MITEKRCGKCKETKVACEFHKDSRRKDGHHNYCKGCRAPAINAYMRNRYNANPAVIEKRNARLESKKPGSVA